uniref:Uncharacterized protein n=1 Tax=Romanomermis culicivorax TaxID=13658 RepID=A0A915HJ06_ROMCU
MYALGSSRINALGYYSGSEINMGGSIKFLLIQVNFGSPFVTSLYGGTGPQNGNSSGRFGVYRRRGADSRVTSTLPKPEKTLFTVISQRQERVNQSKFANLRKNILAYDADLGFLRIILHSESHSKINRNGAVLRQTNYLFNSDV